MIDKTPPKVGEFEISLFGPGIGECVVVCLGSGQWMVVDSCTNPFTNEPIPIEYLRQLGVDPCESIKIQVITHWHADHIRGAAKIFELCNETRIIISAALLKEEFTALVGAFSGEGSMFDRGTSSTRELAKIIRILSDRVAANKDYKSQKLSYALADKVIFEKQIDNKEVQIRTLSPSDKSYQNALVQFSSMMPKIQSRRITLTSENPNHSSVALWCKLGNICALLGADLEETSDISTGWSAILNSEVRPRQKSKIFKVPHHGSKNAHSHDVWEKMIENSPLSLLTTKKGGRSSLPQQSDIDRIRSYSEEAYCTGDPKVKATRINRDPIVERSIKEDVIYRHILGNKIGQIQIRIGRNGEIRTNLRRPAFRL